ncbi:MAG: hypothetical protein WC299_11975, partial [Kiritimatiellia bacterium]
MEAGYMENARGFEFQRDPGLPCWTISMILSGQSHLTYNRQAVTGEPGRFVAVMPNTPYRFIARTVMQEMWCLATLR